MGLAIWNGGGTGDLQYNLESNPESKRSRHMERIMSEGTAGFGDSVEVLLVKEPQSKEIEHDDERTEGDHAGPEQEPAEEPHTAQDLRAEG